MRLVDVPDDVFLQILSRLTIQDVLALKQTCRGLHALGSSDYLWHRLVERSDLPLDIPADTPMAQLPSEELQRLAIRAIRLQLNWRRPSSKIRRTTSLPVPSDSLFELLQFVPGGSWLLVVQGVLRRFEHRNYTRASLWDLSDIEHTRCAVMFEFIGKHRGSAVNMSDGGSTATIVIALNNGDKDFMQIRSVSIDATTDALDPMSPLPLMITSRRLDVPPLPSDDHATALIEGLSVWENGLVATVAVIAPDQEITSRVLLADTRAGAAGWMLNGPDQPIPLPQARLTHHRMVVFGYLRQDFVVRIYGLPPWLAHAGYRLSQEESLDDISWGPLITHHSYPLGNSMMDTVHIPPVSVDFLTIMVFNEADLSQPLARVVRFPLMVGQGPFKLQVVCTRVPLPLDTSIRSVSIGTTGRRAVWMEHNLETTRSRLMKLELGGTQDSTLELSHGILLPSDPPLPFSTDFCHSLAFDEATCRLCLGLFDGRLHVVDFL
ncbi:hypothetical protein PHLGIDRAFT_386921 [Phlebiopsis gigantea 11061_1 CR5-6]|uniref:F-box domain-containing protein n=1 Tax=Phlebiopsis gigantea (strain 11061_1 CR5-6) TaxID=745531 RepID=A0A0C3S063_PHLG1|nr:hypothetical protein PHLGIDRAFT_386921 [Phlebiopsis gigantea 11061_1 CR5-6]